MAIGQFFSQRFGYGVHALAFVATKPAGELTTLPELATWARSLWPGVSEAYLSNIMQQMTRGRLLRSHRGVGGGYSLGRPAADINLRDLVELLEGVDTHRCSLSLEATCPVAGRCAIQRKLGKLEEDYLASLAGVTIAELSKSIEVKV